LLIEVDPENAEVWLARANEAWKSFEGEKY
jgi:hypothetical protein